jgi:hypothetical protein
MKKIRIYFVYFWICQNVFSLELPNSYVVKEIQPHKNEDDRTVILLNYPGVLKVNYNNKEVLECLKHSLYKKNQVKVSINQHNEIDYCK